MYLTVKYNVYYGAGFVMELVFSVTAAVFANTLPSTCAPEYSVMDA
jgi:hypothetical protein